MNNILENKKILLVDDNDFNRMIINIHLKKYNIIIKEAEDGNEAAKILENESFDIMLIDIQMPIYDGIYLIKKIKEMKINTPVIIMTASDESSHTIKELREIGIHDFIYKPFNKNLLIYTLAKKLNENEN